MPYNLNDEEIPQSKRDWLYQELMRKATRENTDAADLAAVQNQAAQQAAGLGVVEAGATIGKALAGGGPQEAATTQALAANRQGLEDYLKQKKLERDSEYDKFQAVKELADLETAKERQAAGGLNLTQWVGIENGKEVPLRVGAGGVGVISGVSGQALSPGQLKFKPTTDYQTSQLTQAAANAAALQGQRNITNQLNESRQEVKEAKGVSDSLLKYNIPGQEEALKVVQSNMKVDPETGKATIPGFSSDKIEQGQLYLKRKFDKLSDKELATRSAFQRLANQELKSQSGAAVTDSEYRRFLLAMQAGSWFDFTPEQVVNYTGLMASEIDAKKKAIGNVSPRGYEKVTGEKVPNAVKPASSGLTPEQRQKKIQELRAKAGK